MSVWDFFDRKVVLTLGPDLSKALEEFNRVGLAGVEPFFALPIDHKEILGPHQSFSGSVRQVLIGAHASSAANLLFLEDDVTFRPMDHLESALGELPGNWDVVYLGANLLCWNREDDPQPERFSEHLFRVRQAWTTHCVAFNRKVIPFLLENQPPLSEMMFDQFLSNSLPSLNAYMLTPMVAWQREHHSTIWDRNTNYDDVFIASQQRLDSGEPWIAPPAVSVQYIRDSDVDAALDLEIRNLLCECFGEGLFRTQRFASEMPAHRWLLRSDDGNLIGHVAAHEKAVFIEHEEVRILGIAEACVHPDHRRGGKLRQMMTAGHEWATGKDFAYSVLFGHFAVYASSGYMPALNLWNMGGDENYSEVMVKALGDEPWPHEKQVYLQGPRF